MVARLTQTNATNLYRSDAEFTPNQVIQGNASSHHIASRLAGSEFHAVLPPERFDRLGFDQGQLEVRFGFEERPLPVGVAIPFEPDTRNGFRLLHGTHRFPRSGADIYLLNAPLPPALPPPPPPPVQPAAYFTATS